MIPPVDAGAVQTPSVKSTAKQMEGMLWYNLLSEMSKNGFAGDALGPCGDAFGSMFLWNIAQNDFGKYDDALTAATVQQLSGRASAVALPVVAAAPDAGNAAAPLVGVAAEDLMAPRAGPLTDLSVQAEQFTKSVWPQIQAAAAKLGVPAQAVLAQAALETGWGAAAAGNNLFGIKAVAGQAGSERLTQEVVNGILTPQNAYFRDYASPATSIADYVGLIETGYANVVGQGSVAGFAQALQQGGYATDGRYAAKIIAISQSPVMQRALAAVGKSP